MIANKELIETLNVSDIYRGYERAFTDITGLPVSLRSVESWQLPHHGRKNENPFCSLMAQKSRACAACLKVQETLARTAKLSTQTVTCEAGLSDTAVPVRFGDQTVGFLQTGQVFRKKPAAAQFERLKKKLSEWGLRPDARMKAAYYQTRVLSPKQHAGMVKLLGIFAGHLAMVSNQVVTSRQNAEAPAVTRAKDYIQQNYVEDLSLGAVAKAVNMSTFYFCKVFKKATGLTFTEYLSRVRVEKARNLLLNPNLRVSEIAFEIGFQSLTHFNRVFKNITGQSPSEYREQLRGG